MRCPASEGVSVRMPKFPFCISEDTTDTRPGQAVTQNLRPTNCACPLRSEWGEMPGSEQSKRVGEVKDVLKAMQSLVESQAEEAIVEGKFHDAMATLCVPGIAYSPKIAFLHGCCADALGDEVSSRQWLMMACAQACITVDFLFCSEVLYQGSGGGQCKSRAVVCRGIHGRGCHCTAQAARISAMIYQPSRRLSGRAPSASRR